MRVAVLSVHTCPLARLGGWETGGMNVYVRELSREMGKRGIKVDVFTRRQDPGVPQVVPLGENARVIHLDAGPPRQIDKYDVLDYLPEFACNLQRFQAAYGIKYDLIHSHYWLSGRVAGLFQDRWGVPVVTMFHTLGEMKNRVASTESEREQQLRSEIERRIMNSADVVIAATPAGHREMVTHYAAPKHKIRVVPAGVNLALFRPGSRELARSQLGITEDRVVLFVGRIQRLKGIDLLLRAVALLVRGKEPLDSMRVLVVGGIPLEQAGIPAEDREIQRLRRLAAQLGIAQLVSFVGAVDQEELPSYYQAADVTVMPSHYESFGLVAVESMACGTPVIASRVGGLASIIRDGETGFLVPWRHPRLFAEKLRLLLTQEELRRQMGHNAAIAAKAYGWERVADETLALYSELLGVRRSSERGMMYV